MHSDDKWCVEKQLHLNLVWMLAEVGGARFVAGVSRITTKSALNA
jgi:hypothetical protein